VKVGNVPCDIPIGHDNCAGKNANLLSIYCPFEMLLEPFSRSIFAAKSFVFV
jgi:hypothetical protein